MTKWNTYDDHKYDAYIGKGYRESSMTLYDYKESSHMYYRYVFYTTRFDYTEDGLRAAFAMQNSQNTAGGYAAWGVGVGISIGGMIIPGASFPSFIGGGAIGYIMTRIDYSYDIDKGDTFTVAEMLTYNAYSMQTKVDVYVTLRDINGKSKVDDRIPM